jgi:hypothetical protein
MTDAEFEVYITDLELTHARVYKEAHESFTVHCRCVRDVVCHVTVCVPNYTVYLVTKAQPQLT